MGSNGRDGIVILVAFLLLGCTYAQDDPVIKEVTDPTGNVNLSPVEQWRSAYMCLQNFSSNCTGIFNLTEEGWVNITSNATSWYCNTCAQHTRAVLTCVSLVHRHYKFRNSATVKDLNNTINLGCLYGFNETTLIGSTSSAWKTYESQATTFISALAAWLFISFVSM